MAISRKVIFAAFIGALPLAGCAAGPYYDNYGYERGYDPGYGYEYGYVAPSVTYSDRSNRYWRDNDGRWHDRGDRREWRDSRDSRDSRPSRAFDDQGMPLYDPNSNVYRGTGKDYDPKQDIGQYSGG